jgi:cation diffusion facilitator family transporter
MHLPGKTSGSGRRWLGAVLANTLAIMVIEMVAHSHSGALSLLQEAVHMSSDFFSVLAAIVSMHAAHTPGSAKFSFGYFRGEILASCLSVALIWASTVYILCLSFERYVSPVPVEEKMFLCTALAALVVSSVNLFIIHFKTSMHSKNLSLRSVYVHILSDMFQSLGVLFTSVILFFRPGLAMVDLICTLAFSVVTVLYTLPIARSIFEIVMEAVPRNISLADVKSSLEECGCIEEVLDLKIWAVSKGNNYLLAKVKTSSQSLSDLREDIGACKKALEEKYVLAYTNVEIE